MRPVGYLLNTKEGLAGQPGLFYDYILAAQGLFIQARSPLLEETILVAPAKVRGLLPLEEKIQLLKGKIPRRFYDVALSALCAVRQTEQYLAVTWEDEEYRLVMPLQEGTGGVQYERLPNTVLDIHSHGTMPPFFSGTDDRDEQSLRLYAVVGRLDTLLPEVEIRIGVYGYFAPIKFEDIFEERG